MSIVDNDVIRVTLTWDMPNNTIAQNVFYAVYMGDTTQIDSEIQTSIGGWINDMYLGVMPILSTAVAMNSYRVEKQVSEVPLVFEHLFTEPITLAGTDISDMLPHGVAMVVRAGTVALKGLARKYLPGITEGWIDNSTWVGAALTVGANFVTFWLLGADGARPGEDYFAGIIQVATGIFKALDGTGAVSTLAGYQRRRKPGVGA